MELYPILTDLTALPTLLLYVALMKQLQGNKMQPICPMKATQGLTVAFLAVDADRGYDHLATGIRLCLLCLQRPVMTPGITLSSARPLK